jgi:hypothetical protein
VTDPKVEQDPYPSGLDALPEATAAEIRRRYDELHVTRLASKAAPGDVGKRAAYRAASEAVMAARQALRAAGQYVRHLQVDTERSAVAGVAPAAAEFALTIPDPTE